MNKRLITFLTIPFLTLFQANPAHAEGAGIALVKRREGESPEFWKPFLFSRADVFTVAVKLAPLGSKDTVSVPRSQVGAVIEIPDFKTATIDKPDAIATITAKRKQLEELAKTCTAAASILTSSAQELKKAEEKFAAGNVLRIGKWIDLEAIKRAELAKAPPIITIPSMTIAGQTFTTVQLDSFSGTIVGIKHSGGTQNFLTTSVTDDQIRQLNTTSTYIKVVRP